MPMMPKKGLTLCGEGAGETAWDGQAGGGKAEQTRLLPAPGTMQHCQLGLLAHGKQGTAVGIGARWQAPPERSPVRCAVLPVLCCVVLSPAVCGRFLQRTAATCALTSSPTAVG